MTKWEYIRVIDSVDFDLQEIQDLGKQGWEMCSMAIAGIGAAILYFKRPVSQPMKMLSSRTERNAIRKRKTS